MALGAEGVLLLAGEPQAGAVPLGGLAHGHLVVRVGQAVERHVVLHDHVAVLVPLPLVQQQVRGTGHGLHAAGHHDVHLAGADELVGQGDRVQSGQAHLVDRERRYAHGNARTDRGLAGRDLPGAGLQHLAHDHILDLLGAHPGAVKGRLDRDRAELRGREVLEGAEQPTHRGTGAVDDDRAHACRSLRSRPA